jgi:Protein of unknown function (DUF4239)
VIAAVLGLVLVQRLVPSSLREEHNDVAGFIYAVVGVMYAVLMAFVVIVVWQAYEAAKDTVESEANELAGVYFLADRFPDPERERVRGLARSYARVVVEEEWPLMERGEISARDLGPARAQVQPAEHRCPHERGTGALRPGSHADARGVRRLRRGSTLAGGSLRRGDPEANAVSRLRSHPASQTASRSKFT